MKILVYTSVRASEQPYTVEGKYAERFQGSLLNWEMHGSPNFIEIGHKAFLAVDAIEFYEVEEERNER